MGSVDNGLLYEAKAQEANSIYVLHVYGTPYEMGWALNLPHQLTPVVDSILSVVAMRRAS